MQPYDLRKVFLNFKEDPVLFIIRFLSLLYLPILRQKKGLTIGKGLVLKGKPILEVVNGGEIKIGDNVTLYSTKKQYFAHLSSPVRLFAEDQGVIIVDDNTRINGATIHARKSIKIGKNCLIAANTSIIDSNGHENCFDDPKNRLETRDEPIGINIDDCVWIGINCTILKGVKIGYGSIIGTSTVINIDIPAYSLAFGNPVKIKSIRDS